MEKKVEVFANFFQFKVRLVKVFDVNTRRAQAPGSRRGLSGST